MNFYIKYTYQNGSETGRSDYIGPFPGREAAKNHQQWLGPLMAEIVTQSEYDDDTNKLATMSPEDNYAYQLKRW